MSDAFISYSRKNMGFARLLKDAFDEEGIDAWIDWQDIPPSADWLAEVYQAIENSNSFIFLISENSVVSEICSLEIAHALKNHKRIIPIVVNEVEPERVPEPLSAINWIFFTQENQFANSIQNLIESIQVDQDWIRQHTMLQRRALQWDRKNRSRSSLLRGQELEEAETFLAEAAGKDLQPTEVQTTFILSSRQADTKRRRRISYAAVAGMILLFALSVMAFVQRSQAVRTTRARATAEAAAISERNGRATAQAEAVLEEQALATSQVILDAQYVSAVARGLAVQAEAHGGEEVDTGLLLAVEAVNIERIDESFSGLLNTLTDVPHLKKFLVLDPNLDITGYSLSPDGSLFAAASDEMELLFFDTESGDLIDTVPAPHQPADAFSIPGPMERPGIRFSQDGTRLLTVGEDPYEDLWYLWDVDTRQPDPEPLDALLENEADDILTISEDFRILAAENGDNICFWETDAGTRIQCLQDPPEDYTFIRLSPDGSLFVSTNEESELQLWDTSSGTPMGEPYLMFDQEKVNNILISPDNTLLLATGERMTHLWDLETGDKLVSMNHEPFGSPVYHITFTQDSRPFVFDNYFDKINATDLLGTTIGSRFSYFQPGPTTGLDEWLYRDEEIFSFRVYPDHNLALTFRSKTVDTEIILWDMDLQYQVPNLLEYAPDGMSAVFHPTDPDLIAMAVCSNAADTRTCPVDRVQISSIHDPENIAAELIHEESGIEEIAFNPSGELLALGDTSGLIHLWDWQNEELIGEFENLSGSPAGLAFSSDGSLLAAGAVDSGSSLIITWQVETGELIGRAAFEGEELFGLGFSRSGTTVACAMGTHVAVWDPESSEAPLSLNPIPGVEDYTALDYSPDGSYLAAGGENGLVVWDAETYGVTSQPLPGQTSSIHIQSLEFSPDSEMIAAGSPNQQVSLWDPISGRQIGPQLEGKSRQSTDAPYMVSFSADGNTLVSTARRTPVTVWNFNLENWIDTACSMANRTLTPEEWTTFMGDQPYDPVCR